MTCFEHNFKKPNSGLQRKHSFNTNFAQCAKLPEVHQEEALAAHMREFIRIVRDTRDLTPEELLDLFSDIRGHEVEKGTPVVFIEDIERIKKIEKSIADKEVVINSTDRPGRAEEEAHIINLILASKVLKTLFRIQMTVLQGGS